MKIKSNLLKLIAVIFTAVFFITAVLFFIEFLDKKQNVAHIQFDKGVATYKGKDYVLKQDIETLLVLGLDKYEGATSSDSQGKGVQADFLMLFVLDNASKQYTAIQINRDTMANVNKLGVGGGKIETVKKQIALAYNYVYDNSGKISCRNTSDAVEDLLLGVDVDHYVSLTLDSVKIINDLVGGVEVTMLDDFTSVDESMVKDQNITLTGDQALLYVRERYGLEDSTNNTRMKRQRQYINALYEKTMSCIKADENFAIDMIDKIADYTVYDSTDYRMKEYAEKFNNYEFLGIKEIAGESVKGDEFMEFYPDEDALLQLVIDMFYNPKN